MVMPLNSASRSTDTASSVRYPTPTPRNFFHRSRAVTAYRRKIGKKGLTLSGAVQVGYLTQSFKGSEVFIPDDDDFHAAAGLKNDGTLK